eukprot:TRINITY_DN26638_c0_g1_i1.p1 TRINITY_DN26638_c0_g1~~TRINITY_DN26638_c0_g1_i1.p1  ORF type:complete len:370 (+),score=86.48 TRINITY_DN26638_c0_g1_i1:174-1283(+)
MAEEPAKPNPRVFLDISMNGQLNGRLVIELFADVCPKTAENFRALCTGEKGIGPVTGLPLHYKGCPLHRIIKGFMVQGGDFSNKNGTGGESIYGEKFEDEEGGLKLKHDNKGIVSMANAGPNTNGSQFFILTASAPHLDGKHCVFGRVVKGLGLLKWVEKVPTGANDAPDFEVSIADCGEVAAEEVDPVVNWLKDGDMYSDYPADVEGRPKEISFWLKAADDIKAKGTEYLKEGNFFRASRKYHKALGFLDEAWEKKDLQPEDHDRIRTAREACLTNSAMCKLKMGDYAGVLQDCHYVLLSNQNNVKALFRKGQALLATKDLEGALQELKKAHELAPGDGGIKAELAKVKKILADQAAKEKQTYAKMFG